VERSLTVRADDWKKEKDRAGAQSTPLLLAWLHSQQNPATGLIQSFDGDEALVDVGFTYDQALGAMTFVSQGEFARGARIFAFFRDRAPRVAGGFVNAYDVRTGAVAEYTVHTGPSIYLALAILAYEDASHDATFLPLAVDIGDWVLALQTNDARGALPGGPNLSWVSTEHNIAAYALFSRLAQQTQEQKYRDGRECIMAWMSEQGVNRRLRRLNRGEEDSMIATDVMALGMLAFTPTELASLDLSADDLVACVEENCKSQVWLAGKNGTRVCVEGYDFSCPSSVGRQGTIAVEWTAQMITVYRRLAQQCGVAGNQFQSELFQRKADFYLNEIDKLLVARADAPGGALRVGLPYATDTGVDTGHGWFTPDHNAISVAGTCFAILAKQGYNIFNVGLGDTHSAKDGI